MSFTTQSNHYFSSNSSLILIELIITSHHRRHLFLNTIAMHSCSSFFLHVITINWPKSFEDSIFIVIFVPSQLIAVSLLKTLEYEKSN